MLAGDQSLTLQIAYSLPGRGDAMKAYAAQDTAAAYEEQRGELFGLTLGDDPQWALLEFADLVIALAPAAPAGRRAQTVSARAMNCVFEIAPAS